jgi:septal ring factor EnvC (AmiA/AmiB activator)
MEPTNLVLSAGTILTVIGLFYSWHKDSKQTAEEMADLKARVNTLEDKAKQTEAVLQELLSSVQEIKVALAKIDTKITQVEKDINILKSK